MYRLVKLHVGVILAEIPPYFDRERVGEGAKPLVLVCMEAKPCADTTDIRGSEAKQIYGKSAILKGYVIFLNNRP